MKSRFVEFKAMDDPTIPVFIDKDKVVGLATYEYKKYKMGTSIFCSGGTEFVVFEVISYVKDMLEFDSKG